MQDPPIEHVFLEWLNKFKLTSNIGGIQESFWYKLKEEKQKSINKKKAQQEFFGLWEKDTKGGF